MQIIPPFASWVVEVSRPREPDALWGLLALQVCSDLPDLTSVIGAIYL